MDLLGVGVPELIVIIILALIFVGPRDLPRLAARAAEFLREIRKMSESLTTEWQKEVNAADLDLGGLKELSEELSEAQKSVKKMTSLQLNLDDVIKPDSKNSATSAPKKDTAAEASPPPPPEKPEKPSVEETPASDQPNE